MSAQQQPKTLVNPGRLVILLNGRHAGKKAIVIAVYPEPTETRKYPHCVVLGIEKPPKKVTRDMPQEALVKRTQIKCFLKTVNFNHILLTRHVVKADDDLLTTKIKPETVVNSLRDPAEKKAQLEQCSKVLRQKYLNNKLAWLFKPLQF